jgi:hypothetical protein
VTPWGAVNQFSPILAEVRCATAPEDGHQDLETDRDLPGGLYALRTTGR